MTVTIIVSASRWLNQSHREVAADELDDFADAVSDGPGQGGTAGERTANA